MNSIRSVLLFIIAAVSGAMLSPESQAAGLPINFAETEIAGQLDPTSMTFAPDGRIFVCEKNGKVRVVKNGALLATPFVTITVDNSNERGLQSLAFDPEFATNQRVYIFYTAASPSVRNRVSRFTANGDVAVAGSELILIETENLSGSVHNGGALHFRGTELFISTGESGNGSNSQDLTNKLGKILSINRDGTIPTDNPFLGTANAQPSIWAYGLRNPFTFGFQPGTGRMFINDVGAGSFEEINDGIAGSNYGWPNSEGPTSNLAYRTPFYAYSHSGGGCAIAGGAFYNPTIAQFPPAYVGRYFFADYCNGRISTINPANPADVVTFATGVDRCIDIDVAPDGTLYYIARGGQGGGSVADNTSSTNGRIFRVVFTGSQAPSISVQPQNTTVPIGESATFTVAASGTNPLGYQWSRNNVPVDNGTAATLVYGPVVAGDNGALFKCVVTNAFGNATSNVVTLSATTNTRPNATILTPTAGTLYSGGGTIAFSGSASDFEDGTLGASAFTWRIGFFHDDHDHPAMASVSGITSSTYNVASTGETSASVFYRVFLTVTDSQGLSRTVSRDILPRTANLTFTTVPTGLRVYLDGAPATAPFAIEAVAGIERTVGLENPQILGGSGYRFVSWSDGGALAHTITPPAVNTTYTATFASAPGSVGTGLKGEYFTNQARTFNGAPTLTRNGEAVNFSWGGGSPDPSISVDNFTARWTGQVQPQFTETYTFFTSTDDGVRLWVDDQPLVDKWVDQGETTWSGSIALVAGRRYAIRMEFFENGGDAAAKLSWSSPSQSLQIIPVERLFPDTVALTLSTPDGTAQEAAANTGNWLVSRTGLTGDSLEVNFTRSGTAAFPADYSLSSGSAVVTIPAGQAAATVTLSPVTDLLVEGTENATLTLAPGFGYALGTGVAGTIQIQDSPLDAWKIAAFGSLQNAQSALAADTADWEGDGIANAVEFGLDATPTAPDASRLPTVNRELIGGSEYLTLTFRRKKPTPAGLNYIVESTGDLAAAVWTPAVIVPGFPADNGNGTETVKARDTVPVLGQAARFMRLRVVRQ